MLPVQYNNDQDFKTMHPLWYYVCQVCIQNAVGTHQETVTNMLSCDLDEVDSGSAVVAYEQCRMWSLDLASIGWFFKGYNNN